MKHPVDQELACVGAGQTLFLKMVAPIIKR